MALMPASRAKLRAAGAEPHPWQRGSAQVMAKLNFPPPARPIEHGNKCTKTAPAAEQF
jgi:hypothetical protein